MAVDNIVLAPESFRTIYLRREDRVIMRTERGEKIIVKRVIPEDWIPVRIYDYENLLNDNKKEIFLFDNEYVNQLTEEHSRAVSQ